MTTDALWHAIERVTGRKRTPTVSVKEYAEIVGISTISGHRMAARGDIQTLDLPIVSRRIPVDEVFRAFGVEMGTSVNADAPGDIQETLVPPSPGDDFTP